MHCVKFNDVLQYLRQLAAQVPHTVVDAFFIAIPDPVRYLFFTLAPPADYFSVLVGSHPDGGCCYDTDVVCYGRWRYFS